MLRVNDESDVLHDSDPLIEIGGTAEDLLTQYSALTENIYECLVGGEVATPENIVLFLTEALSKGIKAALEKESLGDRYDATKHISLKLKRIDNGVAHGRWIDNHGHICCSVCGRWCGNSDDYDGWFEYYPCCGAKMDGECE